MDVPPGAAGQEDKKCGAKNPKNGGGHRPDRRQKVAGADREKDDRAVFCGENQTVLRRRDVIDGRAVVIADGFVRWVFDNGKDARRPADCVELRELRQWRQRIGGNERIPVCFHSASARDVAGRKNRSGVKQTRQPTVGRKEQRAAARRQRDAASRPSGRSARGRRRFAQYQLTSPVRDEPGDPVRP